MKKHKLIAALLSLSVVLAAIPIMTDTAEAEDTAVTASASGWQPKPTKTVSSKDFPITIGNDEIVQIDGPVDYTAATGKNPITIESGATARIIINGNVSLKGADARDTTGATAAIYVPENSSLTIYSAHDEELSKTKDAPKDTLTVTGGNAAAGENGKDAKRKYGEASTGSFAMKKYSWDAGAAGNGGGGAAAAIGGNGGNGGSGAAAPECKTTITIIFQGKSIKNLDDNKGAAGSSGKAGKQGSAAGTIAVSGRLNLEAIGGNAAAGGNGGSGCEGFIETTGKDDAVGGCGGGGGGGGGLAAPAIGAGGAGGAGGGSGGTLSSDHNGNVQGCGGGGGAGGWPNGGGGGGGGAECSDAENHMDNSSYGGAGGPGGAAGSKGNSGSEGFSTGTKGHGINKDNGKYDAEPGKGGAGGGGVSAAAASGGAGGKEKDNKYNGGKGGSSGAAVARTSWHTQGNLVLSTAGNLKLDSSLSYQYGDGQGYGSMTAITPNVIYDLMDCKVNLASCTYPGADSEATTKILSITYDATTDRDGIIVGTNRTLAANRAQIASYTGLRHVDKGQAAVTGNNDADRISAVSDQSVVGSTDAEFTINKAKLDVEIKGELTEATVGKEIPLTIGNVYDAEGHSINLNNLCIDSSANKGHPNISWEVTKGDGSLKTNSSGTSISFTPQTSGQVQLTVTISGMNDYEDFSKTINFATGQTDIPAEFSPSAPHPRMPITVILPTDLSYDDVTITWYVGQDEKSTGKTYIVDGDSSGSALRVLITPKNTNSKYRKTHIVITKQIEEHEYDDNGFCTICDEYKPPLSFGNNIFSIENGGNLFWFAALVNNDSTHADFSKLGTDIISARTSAKAYLSNNINLEGSKGRMWIPIGTEQSPFEGVFSGTEVLGINKTMHTITDMQISDKSSYVGLIGNSKDAAIKDFAIEGSITLPTSGGKYIGGAVGYISGGTISNVTSKVAIQNEGGNYAHIGGVIGSVQKKETKVTKCIFEGGLHISNNADCLGGIAGYTDPNGYISYCANLGTVVAVAQDVYTGGILGYANNTTATVKNCYSYGVANNGGGNYAGAIIGRMRNAANAATRFKDNYYLDNSAPSGFGLESANVAESEKPKAISKSAFDSGQVCYLVNGKISTNEGAVWRQNIDNNKQNDGYPLFTPAIVYLHSDGVYSNYPESVSVDISWGSMSFEYQKGEWSPYNHAYDAGWVAALGDDEITIENKSNVAIMAGFNFTPNDVPNLTGLVGTISGENSLRLEKGASTTATLSLSSNEPTADLNNVQLGTITITITAAGDNMK